MIDFKDVARRAARVVLAGLLASACLASAARVRPSPGADPRDAASRFVRLLATGDFESAAGQFNETMKGGLPAEKLRGVWQSVTAQVGPFQKQVGLRREREQGYRVVYVECGFERGSLDVKVVFDDGGRVAGLFILPPRAVMEDHLPDYLLPGAFREQHVTVGAGAWSLPGTLLVPAGQGPFPALVLVHGSGPEDRDETIGPNRPFRDMALGLASRGIAVVRYDKRTLALRAEAAALGDRLTFQEETVDDAAAAVTLLRAVKEVDGRRIFVLGHSLGGVAAPRIAALDARIAGFILMATPSRPLEETLLEQETYLASLDGAMSEEEKAALEVLKKQIAHLQDPDLAREAGLGDLPLGMSRTYWLDLRRGTGPSATARLRQPMLVIQGGRDYQVTAEDFRGWKEALAGRGGVEFRFYPTLNHLFIDGKGKSTPAEYFEAGHVARVVIDDIAAWIKARPAAAMS